MSVEFDGLGHGFSKDGKYVPLLRGTEDPYRKLKLDLKLRVCEKANYALFVVSYDEINPIEKETHLTITDGLIGNFLAKQEFDSKIGELLHRHREEIRTLTGEKQGDAIESLIFDLEYEANMKWNPISQKASMFWKLVEKKLGFVGHSVKFLPDPMLPKCDWSDPTSAEKYIEAFKDAIRGGCVVQAKTPFGEFSSGPIWVGLVEACGLGTKGLAKKIAELILYKTIYDRVCGMRRKSGWGKSR
jgi:hypothetical protein